MIVSFRDGWLRDFFIEDIRSRKIPPDIEDRLFRKIQMIDDAAADQDLRVPLPEPERLLDALTQLRARDGGYANTQHDRHGITTVTAAAVSLLRALDGPIDPHLGMWLLDRCHASGGFVATPAAPVPDLLSTATGLHALATLHVPLTGVYESCLDFVDSLWTNRGGFFGSWVDDTLDCEYTYYGLLALGHLTAAAPA